jgi:hypothetical protein
MEKLDPVMNEAILYQSISEVIQKEDREFTKLTGQGIFYCPELYVAVVMGKAIKLRGKKLIPIFQKFTFKFEHISTNMIDTIKTYLAQERRNKLIIMRSLNDLSIEKIDIGKALSKELLGQQDSKYLAQIANEKIVKLLNSSISYDERFGKYLAISNIGILFEPDLKITVSQTFKNYSQNNVLFVEWPGWIENDTLFFLSKEKGIKLSLKDISFLKI